MISKTSKISIFSAVIIALFVIVAFSAPLIQGITGLDPDSQNVFNRYQMPLSRASLSQDFRESQMESFIKNHPDVAANIERDLRSHGLIKTPDQGEALFELAALPVDKALEVLRQLPSPESLEVQTKFKSFEVFHVFGTDELGRDVFIRLIYGSRVSISVGILVALVAALIGLLIGSLAGFYGGFVDTLLMRTTDALLSLPLLPVMIVVAAIDLKKISGLAELVSQQNESIVKMILILCLFSWMTVARLVRGGILSLKEREFILASRTLGATDWSLITRHLIPNVLAPIVVAVTLGVGESILFEAALSFLGLGIQPPTPSWGNMLFNAQDLVYRAPHLAILPGLMILLTVMSFNYLGDGLQNRMDPKSTQR